MAYAVKQDMIDRFGERELIHLTDRVIPPVGAIEDTVLARAIGDAEAEIDAYISARYPLPLASIPALLIRLACDIARYYLYFYTSDIPEAVRTAYEDSIAFLKTVAKGGADLAVTPPATPPEQSPGMASSTSTKIFDSATWEKF